MAFKTMKSEAEIRAEFNRYIEIIYGLKQQGISNDRISAGHMIYEFQILCWVLNEDINNYF